MKKYANILSGAVAISLLAAAGLSFAQDSSDQKHRQGHSILRHLDSDGDHQISQDEYLAGVTARTERRFSRRDSNGDGVITFDEVQPPENDGGIDRDALRACIEDALDIDLPDPLSPEERFAEGDLNSDGAIDLDEASTNAINRATTSFAEKDSNNDGFLDTDEIRASLLQRREFRQTRKACRDEQQTLASFVEG